MKPCFGYVGVCHPAGAGAIMWAYDDIAGRIVSSAEHENHCQWSFSPDFPHDYDCSGRVDPIKKVGSIALGHGLPRGHIRKVVEDAVAEFPGIKFRVFYDGDFRPGSSMSVQEFWEETE